MVIVQTVIAVSVLLGIHEKPGPTLGIHTGQSAVVMVLVGQENIQFIISDPKAGQGLLHGFQALLFPEPGIHHQAAPPVPARNQEYFYFTDTFLVAV